MFAFGTAPVSSAEFQLAQDLSTSSLRVSIALLDQSGQSVLTTISLTWTATDSVSQGTNNFHTSAPGMREWPVARPFEDGTGFRTDCGKRG